MKIQKHKEKLNVALLKYLYFCTFLLGISSAFVLYIESDYFKIGFGSDNVAIFFIAAYGAALVLMLNWHHLIRKYGKLKVFIFSLFVKMLMALILALTGVSAFGIWLLIIYIIFTVINWLDMDNLLETCSVDKRTGKIRGLYLTIENFGYLVAPLAAGILISKYGFQAAFLVSFIIMFAVTLIVIFSFKNVPECSLERTDFFAFLKKVFARKNVMRAYYISFLLEFFYALMIIYTPLYLLDLGFDWLTIGKIFTVMLLPFVLLQYPAGHLADKKFEEKDMMIFALLVLSLSTGAVYFINSKSVLVWGAVLFATRIGASLIEVLRDSYFYKRIDQRDVDIVDFFRTVRPAAYIVGLLVATPVVYFLHIRFIFPLISVVVLTGLFSAKNLASSRIPPQKKR